MTTPLLDSASEEAQPNAAPLVTLTRVLVVVILVVGVVGRFVTRSDLWLDEALSVNIAKLPLGDITGWLRHDGAPPLYYWMLHAWMSAFGDSDFAVRSLSGVVGLGAFPLAWACGRRVAGENTAWITVVVLALNPFAIRFATETRMYGLEITLVFGAILAVRRAFERPSIARLAVVAAITSALLYTHYWCLSFVAAGVCVVGLIWLRTSGASRNSAARILGAMIVGGFTLVAWLPALAYQRVHTGTPWAVRQFPTIPMGRSILEFAGCDHAEGWAIVYACVAVLIIGVFGHATRHGTIEFDLRNHSTVAPEAMLGVLALGFGAGLAYVSNSGFQARYSAIVLPCFVVVLARGIAVFASHRVRFAVVSAIVVVGVGGLIRNVTENRTQMGDIASSIAGRARSNDVVIYCPDQLGPATHRVLRRTPQGRSLREYVYPVRKNPLSSVALVDWVDYTKRLGEISPIEAATRTLKLAGPHSIFVVSSAGYITHDALCPSFVTALATLSGRDPRYVIASNPEIFEHGGYYEFPR